jgi:hypothetical protein
MRIIVINPDESTIEERELNIDESDDGAAQTIREIIGDTFTSGSFMIEQDGVGNILYVDDDGCSFALPTAF